jgi:exodeoxyribonuclease-5
VGIELDENQKAALQKIIDWYKRPVEDSQLFHLYGYAGTGKSTIVDFAKGELGNSAGCSKIVTAAYTGKAATILQKYGSPEAQTIHSLLYVPVLDEQGRLIGWNNRLETDADLADLIILDECSMIGQKIADDLKALRRKILVIGDPGQLPPVKDNPGFHTGQPEVFLEKIHRQAEGNPIIRLATMVRNGEKLPKSFNEADVWIEPYDVTTREAFFHPGTQIICGTNKNRHQGTRFMRERLGITSQLPQPGEPVICVQTNYRYNIFNGFMGNMGEMEIQPEDVTDDKGRSRKKDDWYIDVYMEDLERPIYNVLAESCFFKNTYNGKVVDPAPASYGQYSHFDYAYLITCHKAQGSGFEHVTIVDDSDALSRVCDPKKWLYTAITRSKNGLVLLHRRYR